MSTTTHPDMEARKAKATVMVHRLDTDKVSAILREVIKAQWGEGDDVLAGLEAENYVIAAIPDTDDGWGEPLHAIICKEGVGWEQDEYNLIRVGGYYNRGAYASTTISAQRLLDCKTGEEIDLADWIRTFVDRLEINFWIWHHRLTVGGKQ